MYHDSVLHALTEARLDDLLGDAAHAQVARTARRRVPAHRAPGRFRRLMARAARRSLLPGSAPRPAEQAV